MIKRWLNQYKHLALMICFTTLPRYFQGVKFHWVKWHIHAEQNIIISGSKKFIKTKNKLEKYHKRRNKKKNKKIWQTAWADSRVNWEIYVLVTSGILLLLICLYARLSLYSKNIFSLKRAIEHCKIGVAAQINGFLLFLLVR